MQPIYIVGWPRGDLHVYTNEGAARKSMLKGDKLLQVVEVKDITKEDLDEGKSPITGVPCQIQG
jgi:hypothetical protein